ncbi:MAG TPA: leucine-rich repeat domain-containing protein [Verrucomicrobiae bacterium]
MSQASFINLCRSQNLASQTAYTLVKMLGSATGALSKHLDTLWEATPQTANGILAKLSEKELELAWSELEKKTWISFQRDELADLSPLALLTGLETLVLSGHPTGDIAPLASLTKLRKLYLASNELTNLNVLGGLKALEFLDLRGNPAEDLKFLGTLPRLKALELSPSQMAHMSHSGPLNALVTLKINGSGDITLEGMPAMPQLVNLRAANLTKLDCIGNFPKLENVFLKGSFSKLHPLHSCAQLTHLELWTDEALDAAELPVHLRLRSLAFNCPKVSNLLAAKNEGLREFRLAEKTSADPEQKEKLLQSLRSWDEDFLLPKPKSSPSAKMETVTESEFLRYNGQEAYGLRPEDLNEAMMWSERDWLLTRLEKALGEKFKNEKDFNFPINNGMFRSSTLSLLSRKAIRDLPWIVATIQKELCQTKHDWIIYCGTEDGDFDVWIYPDRLVTTEKDAKVISKIMKPWWKALGF